MKLCPTVNREANAVDISCKVRIIFQQKSITHRVYHQHFRTGPMPGVLDYPKKNLNGISVKFLFFWGGDLFYKICLIDLCFYLYFHWFFVFNFAKKERT